MRFHQLLFWSLCLACCSTTLLAQDTYDYQITGEVSIPGFDEDFPLETEVFAYATSIDESVVVVSAPDGTYELTVPDLSGSVDITIETFDYCLGIPVAQEIVAEGPGSQVVDFEICVDFVPDDCYAEFGYDNAEGLSVDFAAYSNVEYTGDNYQWDFGDGVSSTDENPTHTYAESGIYPVALTVSNDTCAITTIYDVWIYDGTCQALFFGYLYDDFVTDSLLLYVQDVSFTASEIIDYTWTVGDVEISSNEPLLNIYVPDQESVELTLTITTADSCVSSYTETLFYYDFGLDDCYVHPVYYNPSDDPFTFAFEPEASGSIIDIVWHFGDGTFSSELAPTHTYSAAGVYEVLIEASIVDGADTCLTDWVEHIYAGDYTNSFCYASFSYVFMEEETRSIYFFDQSYAQNEDSELEYLWDFGDGMTSTEINPTHSFAEDGTYYVSLTITSDDGCTSFIGTDVLIDDETHWIGECLALFYAYPFGFTGLTIQIENYSFALSDIVSYEWDFGDGATSTEQTPEHTYNDFGSYEVSLTITSAAGCQSTWTQDVTLGQQVQDCETWFYYVESDVATPGYTYNFEGYYWGPYTTEALSYQWDFGDGSAGTGQVTEHTYMEAGEYQVTLVTVGADSCVASWTEHIYVGGGIGPSCQAFYTWERAIVDTPGFTYQFTDYSTLFGDVNTWNWDFGDGNTSTEQSPMHTYQEPGVYTVTLSITGPDNCGSSYTEMIDTEACVCPEYYDPVCAISDAGDTLTFSNICFAECGGYTESDVFSCAPECNCPDVYAPVCVATPGGGQIITFANACEAECAGFDIDIVYPCDGGGTNCYVYFSFENVPDDPLTVIFDPLIPTDGAGATFFWEFGDGSQSELVNPTHTYAESGVYEVRLRVNLPNGCVATYVENIIIGVDIDNIISECQALFWFEQDADDPFTFQFDNQSTVDSTATFNWDFGDGNFSSERMPTHTYAQPGIYLVALTVSQGDCNSYFAMLVYTDESLFYADGCQALFIPFFLGNNQVLFIDLSNTTGSNVSRTWDFGDGNSSTQLYPLYTYETAGEYTVTLTITDDDGCESAFRVILDLDGNNFHGDSAPSALLLNNTEEPAAIADVRLYPNPTTDALFLDLELRQTERVQTQMFNSAGQLIHQETQVVNAGTQTIRYATDHWAAGIYRLRLVTTTGVEVHDFVVQR